MATEPILNKLRIRRACLNDIPTLQELLRSAKVHLRNGKRNGRGKIKKQFGRLSIGRTAERLKGVGSLNRRGL
jgi:hypothetical protein